MTRLFINTTLLLTINIVLGAAYCVQIQRDRSPERWETLGTLFLIGSDEHHENVFLGSSYSFAFSRCAGAHQRVEHALQEPFLNLSTPGGGVLPAKIFLEQYFDRGNTARDVVYFADVPFFYSRLGNEHWITLVHQPLDVPFLISCIKNGEDTISLYRYFRQKFTLKWLVDRPLALPCGPHLPESAVSLAEPAIETRYAGLQKSGYYDEGLREERLVHYMRKLEDMIENTQAHGARVTIVVLPTMPLREPGERLFTWHLQEIAKRTGVTISDLAGQMREPEFFTDLSHLNERGVVHLARNYLAPLLGRP